MKFLFLGTQFTETLLEKTQLYCLDHGIEVVRINIEDLLPNMVNTAQVAITERDVLLTLKGQTHRLSEFSLIWKRRISDNYLSVGRVLAHYRDHVPANVAESLLKELYHLRDVIVYAARHWGIPIINDYDPVARNKPFQTIKAFELGLRAPTMMLSNSTDALRSFLAEGTSAITKPIGGLGYFQEGDQILSVGTSAVDLAQVAPITTPSTFPSLLQERIPSAYELKCVLLGDDLFCVKQYCKEGNIPTTDIKNAYRNQQISKVEYHLDAAIKDKVIQLCHQFKLDLCTLDIIRSTTGEYVFLEINPDGVVEYYSYFLNLSIHKRIFQFLLKKANR